MLVNTSARSLLSGAFQALAAGMDACALSEEEERATSGPGRSRMRLLIGSAASLPAVKTSSSAGNNVERDRNMAHTPPDTPMVSTNRNTRIVCGEGGGVFGKTQSLLGGSVQDEPVWRRIVSFICTR